jgi:hypothetical protein
MTELIVKKPRAKSQKPEAKSQKPEAETFL